MPNFVPLHEIEEMSDDERKFLTSCRVSVGYYDPEKNDFVVRTEG